MGLDRYCLYKERLKNRNYPPNKYALSRLFELIHITYAFPYINYKFKITVETEQPLQSSTFAKISIKRRMLVQILTKQLSELCDEVYLQSSTLTVFRVDCSPAYMSYIYSIDCF